MRELLVGVGVHEHGGCMKGLKLLILTCVVATSTGCVTAEGIGVGNSPYVNPTLAKYSALRDSPDGHETDSIPPVTGLIVVGTVSTFRPIKGSNIEAEYDSYVSSYNRYSGEEGQPTLTLEDFSRTIEGWTKIKVIGVPLLFGGYVKAMVAIEAEDKVEFESAIATFLFGTSRDLVAAETNADGAFVITALLCRDEPGEYSKCARNYQKGLFDATTGRRLKGKLELSETGPHIDPETYRVIEEVEQPDQKERDSISSD